jgi:thiol-disulfide isomerase/thioredoxin
MRNISLIISSLIVLTLISCKPNERKDSDSTNSSIPITNFDGVRPLLNQNNDTTYVINFWATWCAPCIKELPYLENLGKNYANAKVKVILINLDFPNHYQSRLLPFVDEKNLKSTIIMLDDPDANSWINEVDPSWTGSIPATLIYNAKNRIFLEKELTYGELESALKAVMH